MEEKMLRELLAITKENNEILKSLNTQRRWVNFFWAAKWIIIIIIAYSAYVAATPYIDQAQQTYSQLQSLGTQAQELQNMNQKSFTDFLQQELQKRFTK